MGLCYSIVELPTDQPEKIKQLTHQEKMQNDMEQRENETREFIKNLRDKGHTCIVEYETYPIHVGWCNKPVCKNVR